MGWVGELDGMLVAKAPKVTFVFKLYLSSLLNESKEYRSL
jgi:hypothetical protein